MTDALKHLTFDLRVMEERFREKSWDGYAMTVHNAAAELESLQEQITALTRERDAALQDARRYRWLRPKLLAADFGYDVGDKNLPVIVFGWPPSARIGADLDCSIDGAQSEDADS